MQKIHDKQVELIFLKKQLANMFNVKIQLDLLYIFLAQIGKCFEFTGIQVRDSKFPPCL